MLRSLPLTLIAILMIARTVCGQTFSQDNAYVAFYNAHLNDQFESTREPTLAIWWITEQFGNANTPRAKLRDHLTRHAGLFSDSKHAALVASQLKVINRMLDEKRPPNEKRLEQLVYDLRDLNMRQFVQPNSGLRIIGPGSLRFDNLPGKDNTDPDAAEQLRDLGYDAIPTLIDHIDDDTLTRSVDYWRNFTFSHRVLTVDECCGQIIDAILPTGRKFDISSDPKTAKESMKNHYRQLITQKKAEQSHATEPAVGSVLKSTQLAPAR